MYSYARLAYDYDRRRKVANAADQLPAMHGVVERARERIDEALAANFNTRLHLAAILKSTFVFLLRVGAGLAFLEVLREYEMTPASRKVIERAAKAFSRTRILIKPATVLETYESTLYEWQQAIDTAFAVMRRNDRHKDEGSTTTLDSGSFQLVNTGGFSDAVMAECGKVVARAEKLLRQKGLGKVCYGDVHVTNTVHKSTRTLAFYLLNNDTLYVRANLKGKIGPAVTSVVHELAHRLQNKFLQSKKREIDQMYRALGNKQSQRLNDLLLDRSLWPKEGDTYEYRGQTFTFQKIDLTRRSNLVAWFTLPESTAKLEVPLSAYLAVRNPERLQAASTFVTRYAGTDPDENFAEMVAFWCEGTLPADQESMLKEIIA